MASEPVLGSGRLPFSLPASLTQMGHFHKVFIVSSSVARCPPLLLPL